MNYCKALESAITYIENHLTDEITAADAADYAGYSYYHFTRQFTAVLGESVGSYIKKRRLAEAARQLLYTDRRVLDIAVEYGFQSGEAFSRAFKAVYKVSPAVYRKNRLDVFIGAKPKLTGERMERLLLHTAVHPVLTELPDIKVAGLRGRTTLRNNTLPSLWDKLNRLVSLIPDVPEQARGFGICEACTEDNAIHLMNRDVTFSEVAGIEVNSFEHLKEPFVGKILRGGRYAVFTHRGSLNTLTETFEYIWGTWLQNTDEELDCREDFELYDHRFLGRAHPDSCMDIYIPIK